MRSKPKHSKESNYTGRSAFFKRLKFFGLVLLFLVPAVLCLYFEYSALNMREELDSLRTAAGERLPVIEKMEEMDKTFRIGEETVTLEHPIVIYRGRAYFPAEEALSVCGITDRQVIKTALEAEDNVIYQDTVYMSVNTLSEQSGLWVAFTESEVVLYELEEESGADTDKTSKTNKMSGGLACLRLEDMMPDSSGQGVFNHGGLEKIRVMGRFLHSRGQEYSMAWIPLYVNPDQGLENDIRRRYSYYNADFLYTLDYLIAHGGHIGLHGFSHQYGEAASGIGNEFGPGSPFSLEDTRVRVQEAIKFASSFGFTPEFFEFPHYVSTMDEESVVEESFSVIYQQKTNRRPLGEIETVEREDGRTVMYIPTPAGYVDEAGESGKQRILSSLDSLEDGKLPSLFFHPYREYPYIECCTTEDGKRQILYAEDSIMHAIVDKITSMGLTFQAAWEQEPWKQMLAAGEPDAAETEKENAQTDQQE